MNDLSDGQKSGPILAKKLRDAIERGALSPAFQPIVYLQGGAIAGFEVLARWRDETLGPIAPSVFIPLAERLGLIAALSEVIITKACAEALKWNGNFSLALNISPLHFQDSSMPTFFENAVTRSGFPMDRTEIEITESAVLITPARRAQR